MVVGPNLMDELTQYDREFIDRLIADIDDRLRNFLKQEDRGKVFTVYPSGKYCKPNYLVQEKVIEAYIEAGWMNVVIKCDYDRENSGWIIAVTFERKI